MLLLWLWKAKEWDGELGREDKGQRDWLANSLCTHHPRPEISKGMSVCVYMHVFV